MGKSKKTAEKTAKTSLSGKIARRKSMKRSAALTPKLKKSSFAQVEDKFTGVKLTFSETTDSTETENEIEPKEDEILLQGHFVKPPEGSIDLSQIESGVKALFQYIQKTSENKTELFEDEQPIFLQITCVKIAKTPSRQIRLILKHSLLVESSEICLIVNDVGKAKEHEETIEHYEKLLAAKGITNIKTIMPYHQFKTEYGNQFELKRKLLGLYDYFLVESSICGYVARSVGKIFIKKRKVPIPIKMHATNLKEHIEKSLNKTVFTVHSKSDSYIVQVGHTKMGKKEVFENISSIIDELSSQFPGGLDNIRSLGIKTDKSITVPVYLTLKNKREVKVPVIKPKRPKQFKTVTGELTTYITKDVTVLPTGEVVLVDQGMGEESGDEHFDLESDKEQPMESDQDEEIPDKDKDEEFAFITGEEFIDEGAEEDDLVKETMKRQNSQEKPVEDEEGDTDDVLNQAEEMYLNQYEQEQVSTRKTKKANKSKLENAEATLKKSKIAVQEKNENVGIAMATRRGAKKKEQKTGKQKTETKAKKQESIEEIDGSKEDGEAMLAEAEEVYLNEFEQEQTETRKTRKTKVNKTESKQEVPLKKSKKTTQIEKVKNEKPSVLRTTKKDKQDTTNSLNQQEPSRPEKTTSKKRKVSEKTDKGDAETVAITTRQTRKTGTKNVNEEIPTKKSRKTVHKISENVNPATKKAKSEVIPTENETNKEAAEPLSTLNRQKRVNQGKKNANKTTKSEVAKGELPRKNSLKMTRSQATKTEKSPPVQGEVCAKNSKKISKKTKQEETGDTEGKEVKEKQIKSPTIKTNKAKKGKKVISKKEVLKVKLKTKNID